MNSYIRNKKFLVLRKDFAAASEVSVSNTADIRIDLKLLVLTAPESFFTEMFFIVKIFVSRFIVTNFGTFSAIFRHIYLKCVQVHIFGGNAPKITENVPNLF